MGRHRKYDSKPFDAEAADYAVGYMKPPITTRFQKGQSGNPSGRAKKLKTEKEHLTEVLSNVYTMQGPNGPMHIEGLGVLARRLMKDAADGKIGAMKTLLARIDANGIGREVETDSLSKADKLILDQYLELMRPPTKADHDV